LVEELEQQTADAALAELAMQQGSGSPGGGESAFKNAQHGKLLARSYNSLPSTASAGMYVQTQHTQVCRVGTQQCKQTPLTDTMLNPVLPCMYATL
jgi:hypothetical protein